MARASLACPEQRRYAQSGPNGVTLYIAGVGVLAERFGQLAGPQRWTDDLMVQMHAKVLCAPAFRIFARIA